MTIGPNGDSSSKVWVDNHGNPVARVFDVKSSKALIDIDRRKGKRSLCPMTFASESMYPTIYRNGERAAEFRSFYFAVLPNSKDDEQFKDAIAAMRAEANKLAVEGKGAPQSKDTFMKSCQTLFTDTLLIGEHVPTELMNSIGLFLFMIPIFPRFYPTFLLLSYWAVKKSR